MPRYEPGTITREVTYCAVCVDCGSCGALRVCDKDRPLQTLNAAEPQARRLGWRKTDRGWICPPCLTREERL